MKKILCCLLAIGMLLSLAACGKDKEPPPTEPPTETQTTESLPTGPQTIEGKQEFWEGIIKKRTYKPASTSLNLLIKDCLNITVYNDERGRFSFVFSERDAEQGINSGIYSLYKVNSEEVYLQELAANMTTEEFSYTGTWRGVKIDEKKDKQALTQFMNYAISENLPGLDLINKELNNLQKVEYVQTVDGKDEIRLYCETDDVSELPLIPDSNAMAVNEYALYDVEHNGETGTLVYLSQEKQTEIIYDDEEESEETRPQFENYTDRDCAWIVEPSWARNSTTDLLNKSSVLGKTTIKWTLKQDLIKNPNRVNTTIINMVMDPVKQAVCSMSMEKNRLFIKLDYIECTSAVDVLQMPFFVDEEVSASEITDAFKSRIEEVLAFYLYVIDYK